MSDRMIPVPESALRVLPVLNRLHYGSEIQDAIDRLVACLPEPEHDHKGFSEEKCVRCGWVMGHQPLNCANDNTPHVFPSQQALCPPPSLIDVDEVERRLRQKGYVGPIMALDVLREMNAERGATPPPPSPELVELVEAARLLANCDTVARWQRLASAVAAYDEQEEG